MMLSDLMKYFIKKWKLVIVIIAACTILFTGVVWLFCENTVVDTSERLAYYTEEVNLMKEYMDNSILMNADSSNLYESAIQISGISDKDAMEQFIISGQIWEALNEEVQETYLSELIIWNFEEESQSAEITLRHSDESKCMEYSEYLAEQILEKFPQAAVDAGKAECVSDSEVLKKQEQKEKLYKYLQEQLRISTVGYMEKTTEKSAVVFGGLVGCILAAAAVVLCYKKEQENI